MRMPLRGGLKDEFFKALGNLSIRWGRRRLGQRPLLIVWMSLQLAMHYERAPVLQQEVGG